jgi:hypothetical protein
MVGRSRDIKEHELICSLPIIFLRTLDRITCITQLHKASSLNDATIGDIKAWNDSLGQHGKKVESI